MHRAGSELHKTCVFQENIEKSKHWEHLLLFRSRGWKKCNTLENCADTPHFNRIDEGLDNVRKRRTNAPPREGLPLRAKQVQSQSFQGTSLDLELSSSLFDEGPYNTVFD